MKMFETRVQRRIFEPEEEIGLLEIWRKLHNEELHNLCSLPDIISMVKSMRTK
jgi:hypothetical protein